MTSWSRRAIAIAALSSLVGCVTVSTPRFLMDRPDRDWAPTLSHARTLADDGHFEQADSLLARYMASYPQAPQTVEAKYWRALLSVRAPGGTQNAPFAIPLLQTYLAAGPSTAHRTEADALLRAIARVDTLSRATATYVSRGEVATDVGKTTDTVRVKVAPLDPKAQDDEIKRLKDELAKSKDELDRIKKRLAEPPKKPPHSE